MICVLSQAALEDTTDVVMDWLRAFQVPCVRINGNDIDSRGGPSISIGNSQARARIEVDGASIHPESIKVVWYRRWAYNNQYRAGGLFADEEMATSENIYNAYAHLGGELRAVSNFLFAMMDSAVWMGRPSTSTPNKLRALKLASEAGLDIPATLVTASIDELRSFIREHGEVIAKPAGDTITFTTGERIMAVYTSVVSESFLDEAPWDGSFPSLFQEKLKKKYEIRTFYLDGKCYSMAMFTQQKSSTQVDFRKYSWSDPVRTVPYALPSEVEEKLRVLMGGLNLETGSIDMVKTVDGKYVFLEVNPVGQFGMVSGPCNYFLEKKVAAALVQRLEAVGRSKTE